MQVNEAIFRDYDIRGIVGEDIDEKFAYCFGQAFLVHIWFERALNRRWLAMMHAK